MNNGNGSLTISDMTIGFDPSGMQRYVEALNLVAITGSKAVIRDLRSLNTALESGWQGLAEEKFERKLKASSEDLCNKLDDIQEMLRNQFSEIQTNYYQQDANMIE